MCTSRLLLRPIELMDISDLSLRKIQLKKISENRCKLQLLSRRPPALSSGLV